MLITFEPSFFRQKVIPFWKAYLSYFKTITKKLLCLLLNLHKYISNVRLRFWHVAKSLILRYVLRFFKKKWGDETRKEKLWAKLFPNINICQIKQKWVNLKDYSLQHSILNSCEIFIFGGILQYRNLHGWIGFKNLLKWIGTKPIYSKTSMAI